MVCSEDCAPAGGQSDTADLLKHRALAFKPLVLTFVLATVVHIGSRCTTGCAIHKEGIIGYFAGRLAISH